MVGWFREQRSGDVNIFIVDRYEHLQVVSCLVDANFAQQGQ